MSFFDDALADDPRPPEPDDPRPAERYELRRPDRGAAEQLTEPIPVVRLPLGPTLPDRHSRRAAAPTAPTAPTRRHGRRGRALWWRIATTATTFTVVLALAAAALAGFEYRKLNQQLKRVSVLQKKDPNIRNPARQQHAANFLVIGSDTRAGADAKYGNVAGARSDTTMLVHLSPDRAKASIISIPRDAWVDIPDCTASDGTDVPEHSEMFNSAFSIGGPTCTIKTVQKLTGLAVTHFLEIDFGGFESMVKAIGSVTVCSPKSVSDPGSGLTLHPGQNRLDGAQALAYVRARETLGDGSDLGRIKRQQIFLGAVLRQATSGSMLSDPARLTSFLDAATKAITIDKDTSFRDLRALATSLQGLDPKRVTFYTAPIADQNYTPPGTTMTGRVLLDSGQGRVLYDSVINDKKSVWVRKVGATSRVIQPHAGVKSPGARPSGAAPAPLPAANAGQRVCTL